MNPTLRRLPWAAGAFALLLGLAGCGNEAKVAGQPEAASSSAAASTSAAAQDGGAKAPGGAVKTFVTKVLQGKYTEACQDAAPVAPEGQDPATLCADPKMTKSLTTLHDAWAKPGVKLPPEGKVEVSGVTATGDKVTVPDTAITVDGKSLHDLELIGSTGDVSSFKLSLETTKKDGAWYVSDWNIDL